MTEYNPSDDARKCYDVAIQAKRERGDTHWPERLPYRRMETIGNCILYQGDCYEVLPTLGKIDAVVSDPPYVFETSGGGMLRRKRKNMDQIKEAGLDQGFSFSVFTSEQFGSAVFFAHNDQWSDLLPYLAEQFDRYSICSWHKTNPMPIANKHYQPDTEIYVHAWNMGHHPVGDLRDKKRYIVAANGQDSAINHPTVKPIAVMSKIVANVNAATICDPFMGSGTTGVACVMQGRSFIGIEKNPDYFEIACERIRKAYAQADMFAVAAAPVVAPSTQEALI